MSSRLWKCEFCGARFGTREEYRNHKREAHSKGKCEVCDRHVFGTEEDWMSHQESHIRRLSLTGKFRESSKGKGNDEALADSVHSKTGGLSRYRCRKCKLPMDSANAEIWNRHAFECNGLKEKKCGFCGWITFNKVSLDTHLFLQHYGGQVITREQRRIGNGRVLWDAEDGEKDKDGSIPFFDVVEFA